MTTVLITGARGLVGNRLAEFFQGAGCAVVGVSRQPTAIPNCTVSYCRHFLQPLGCIFSENPIDVVVHCAHDVSPKGSTLNEPGTLQWANESTANGTLKQVFISSISSRSDAKTTYGKVKYRLENWFLEQGGSVFRLGLVIGNGGLFGRMVKVVESMRLIPLIGGGRAKVYFNGIDFVTEQIGNALLRSTGNGLRSLQQPEPTTLRALLEAVRDVLRSRTYFVPVPYLPCLAVGFLIHKLRLPGLGISYENLVGLRENDLAEMRSDFLELGGTVEDIHTLVERVLPLGRGAHNTGAMKTTCRNLEIVDYNGDGVTDVHCRIPTGRS